MNLHWRVGAAARFFWTPDGVPSSAPDVVVAGVATKTLAPLRTAATVDGVSAGGDVLTLSASLSASSRGLVARAGTAVLDLGADGVHVVRIARFASATTVVLDVPLPPVSSAAAGSLDWNVWYADFTSGEVGAAVNRNVAWRIDWTRDLGADHPGEPATDSGLIDIVRRPFDTGLTDAKLYAHVPSLRSALPSGQSDWSEARAVGLEMLTERLLEGVLPASNYVDQLDGRQFSRCHALYTAAVALAGSRAAGYDRDEKTWLERADQCVDAKKGRLTWLDADDDGVVDDNEAGGAAASVDNLTRTLWADDSANYSAEDWTVAGGTRRSVGGDR